MLRRSFFILLEIVTGLLLATGVGAALLAWRLAQGGPMEISFAARYVQQALNVENAPVRLKAGSVFIEWPGLGAPAAIRLGEATLYDKSGRLLAAAPDISLGFSTPALLKGALVPTRMILIGPQLYLDRDAQGQWRWSAMVENTPSPLSPLAEGADGRRLEKQDDVWTTLLAPLAITDESPAPLALLRRVKIERGRLFLRQQKSHGTEADGDEMAALSFDVDARRDRSGAHGEATLALLSPDAASGQGQGQAATLGISFERKAGQGVRADLDLKHLSFAQALLLAKLAGPQTLPANLVEEGHFIVSAHVNLHFDPTLALERAEMRIVSGEGLLPAAPLGLPAPLALKEMQADLALDAKAKTLDVQRFWLETHDGVHLDAKIKAHPFAQADVDIDASMQLRGITMALLPRYWPHGIKDSVRQWMTENLTEGRFDAVRVHLTGRLAKASQDSVAPSVMLRSIDSEMELSDFTVHYRRPLPPIIGVAGKAHFDGKQFVIATQGGRLLSLQAKVGTVRLYGLDTDRHLADIRMSLAGPLAAALTVLDHEPFHYASKVGLAPEQAAGDAAMDLHVAFPLASGLTMDRVKLEAKAQLARAGLPQAVSGIDLSEGAFEVAVGNKDLKVKGVALLNGVPAQIAWTEHFPDDAPILTEVQVQARADNAARGRFGLDFPEWLSGPIGVDMTYARARQKSTDQSKEGRLETIEAHLDLTEASIRTPPLLDEKPAGEKATAQLSIVFDQGKPRIIRHVDIVSPSLRATGKAVLRADDYGIEQVTVERFQQGETNAAMVLTTLDRMGGLDLQISGASLDGRFLFKPDPDQGKPSPSPADVPPKPLLRLDAQLDRLMTGDGDKAVRDLSASVRRGPQGWERAVIAGHHGKDGHFSLKFAPDAQDPRIQGLDLTSNDLGGLLYHLNMSAQIQGGRLLATGRSQPLDLDRAVTGTIDVRDYQVLKAPILARLLSAASPQGFANVLRGEPLGFSRLQGQYQWNKGGLVIRDMRTSGSQVGLTAEGSIDLKSGKVNLQGTIVPFSAVNSLLSSIPLLGELLAGGEKEGLFAATYSVKGPLQDPSVSVNPLAVLAPGFLRNLFFVPDPSGKIENPDKGSKTRDKESKKTDAQS
jgi:Protein of unknown function/AsmA-like C-terminal region